LYVMCWISAITIFRVSWYNVSSSQWGFNCANFAAMWLCSRSQSVCMTASWGCRFTRISPSNKQSRVNVALLGYNTVWPCR
jgi:hypothetical protein